MTAAQVSGGGQGAQSREFGHERILEASERGLARLEGGKVKRGSNAGHIGLAASVHRDPIPFVATTAAQVGGVGQGAQGREFGYEGIADFEVAYSSESGLERLERGKVQGESDAGHIGLAAPVHRDPTPPSTLLPPR